LVNLLWKQQPEASEKSYFQQENFQLNLVRAVVVSLIQLGGTNSEAACHAIRL